MPCSEPPFLTVRVLNCSINAQLQALRHQVIARSKSCDVVSPSPQEALSRLRNGEPFDVLVFCNQMDNKFADMLCLEFRRANPEGRIVGISGGPLAMKAKSDMIVDGHDPRGLVFAVTSYPVWKSQFQYARRLTFEANGDWRGWSCDRCCWNVPLSGATAGDGKIQADFAAHSCEAFARENWDSAMLPKVSNGGGKGGESL